MSALKKLSMHAVGSRTFCDADLQPLSSNNCHLSLDEFALYDAIGLTAAAIPVFAEAMPGLRSLELRQCSRASIKSFAEVRRFTQLRSLAIIRYDFYSALSTEEAVATADLAGSLESLTLRVLCPFCFQAMRHICSLHKLRLLLCDPAFGFGQRVVSLGSLRMLEQLEELEIAIDCECDPDTTLSTVVPVFSAITSLRRIVLRPQNVSRGLDDLGRQRAAAIMALAREKLAHASRASSVFRTLSDWSLIDQSLANNR